ncbi:RNA-binding S4 domain-containing protein [Sutterella faecalis]|uniref:RNA-binding S4 domain-containing protein n=1 Tax=Sutterella faecalis TaxID=2584944 RepID=A0ABX5VFU1_9BURK|nr:RNA-binding S4 domain-containing protein [Sutterella faecalis]MBE5692122.1 RNA-binding S4 domain-containing protein [Sutterella sp.]QDA54991.1 RNA-binding S4 domain-containing protein [Sutterella faecalis]
MDSMRIDKWLWAARFFKTRSIAQDEVGLGRVLIGGQRAKPSRDVRVGDRLEIHRGEEVFTVYVEGLSAVRGPAPQAQLLYRETEESVKAREAKRAMMKLAFEPSTTIRQGRPTKREGRELRRFKEEGFR